MNPNDIISETKKKFKNKIAEVKKEISNRDVDLTHLQTSAVNLACFYIVMQMLTLSAFTNKFIVCGNLKLTLTIGFMLSVQVLVKIYKKGLTYINTKLKDEQNLFDLKKLKRQLRRIKTAMSGMNLEFDEDDDEKFYTRQKWKHAGCHFALVLCCFGLKAFFVHVWTFISGILLSMNE
ncbi:hypothetical protein FF2_042943 [Malus domestica]